MSKQIGYSQGTASIVSVHFQEKKMTLELADGRTILLPLERFPEINKLTSSQRKKHKLLAGTGLMFDDLDTVYHISDFLGKENVQNYSLVAEPKSKYGK